MTVAHSAVSWVAAKVEQLAALWVACWVAMKAATKVTGLAARLDWLAATLADKKVALTVD